MCVCVQGGGGGGGRGRGATHFISVERIILLTDLVNVKSACLHLTCSVSYKERKERKASWDNTDRPTPRTKIVTPKAPFSTASKEGDIKSKTDLSSTVSQ